MRDWMWQGCEQCRRGVLSGRGDLPVSVAVSRAVHAFRRRCPAEGAWWQVDEREGHVIPRDKAKRTLPTHVGGLAGEGGA